MKLEFRTLNADEVKVRIMQVFEGRNGQKAALVLYQDSRSVQNVLDDTVGPLNWQRRHTNNNTNCIISIYDEDKKMWVEKEDVGMESNVEKEKGLASDSFKRASINWGIGRELYTAPRIIVPFVDKNMKYRVSWIEYDENKRIIGIVVEELPCSYNGFTENIVFEYPKGRKNTKTPESGNKPAAKKTSATSKAKGIVAENVVPDNSAANEIKEKAKATKNEETIAKANENDKSVLDLDKMDKLSKDEQEIIASGKINLLDDGEERFREILKNKKLTDAKIEKQIKGIEELKNKTLYEFIVAEGTQKFHALKAIGLLECCDEETNKLYDLIDSIAI